MPSPALSATTSNHPPRTPKSTHDRCLLLLVALAALLALVIVLREPLTIPMGVYLDDAVHWSPATPMNDTFVPLGYPLFILPAEHLAGAGGVVALQVLLYLGTVVLSFLLLTELDVPPRLALLGSLPIMLFPEFFDSIKKIWDVGLAAFLFLLLALLCLRMQREGGTGRRGLLLGAVFAAGLFCRPNYVLLVPAIAYALWSSRRRNLLSMTAFVTLAAVLVYSAAGFITHGKPFLPRNGPYNLFAGNNPYAERALLDKLNAEPSLYPAFAALHPDLVPKPGTSTDYFYDQRFQPMYTHDAIEFILHHPGLESRLAAVKILTFFRPDTKVHGLRSPAGLFKAALALPVLILLLALLLPGRPQLRPPDWFLLALDLTYILPFLITNSDPRFRATIDALFLIQAVRLFYLRDASVPTSRQARQNPAIMHPTPLQPL